jgi:HAD superfamily hydrolase (TIGR01459 family)
MAGRARTFTSLAEISDRYAAILCDVWGVVHNGVDAFAAASRALEAARSRGIAVILVTNAPRPHEAVEAQLAGIGVPAAAFDRVVSSGDVSRELIAAGPRRMFHLGPERDMSLFEGLDAEIVEEFEASVVVCTGLFDDETETPDDYADLLRRLRARNLPLVCANPDVVVERGDRLVWCAGALAKDYALLGGRVLIAGKPHAPIYAAALKAAGEVLGREVGRSDTLAIDDGMLTDIKGAAENGIPALYVSGGIHAGEYGRSDDPDPQRLASFVAGHGFAVVGIMPKLR